MNTYVGGKYCFQMPLPYCLSVPMLICFEVWKNNICLFSFILGWKKRMEGGHSRSIPSSAVWIFCHCIYCVSSLLTLTSLGVGITCRNFLFKPHFTRKRRSGWQSNNIFPRLAGCCFRPSGPKSASIKAAGAYSRLNFWPKKPFRFKNKKSNLWCLNNERLCLLRSLRLYCL